MSHGFRRACKFKNHCARFVSFDPWFACPIWIQLEKCWVWKVARSCGTARTSWGSSFLLYCLDIVCLTAVDGIVLPSTVSVMSWSFTSRFLSAFHGGARVLDKETGITRNFCAPNTTSISTYAFLFFGGIRRIVIFCVKLELQPFRGQGREFLTQHFMRAVATSRWGFTFDRNFCRNPGLLTCALGSHEPISPSYSDL